MDFSNIKYLIKHGIENVTGDSFDRLEEEWYYFMHIPKTAGTTFRYVLYDYFKQTRIYPNYFELLFKQKSQYIGWGKFKEGEDNFFPKGKQLLVGHFGTAPIKQYKDHPPIVLSFVRQPVKRVMSSIIFHQDVTRRFHGLSIDDILMNHLEKQDVME